MSRREIVAIIALLIAGFIAYEVIRGFNVIEPDEVAPGETPAAVGAAGTPSSGDDMKALVPAALATELVAVMRERYEVPELPPQAGTLAIAGNPGELFFTRRHPGRTEVCVMRSSGAEVLWSTDTDRTLEIVGSHGAELLLKFVDEPLDGPADAWQPGGFLGLDMLAPAAGMHEYPLDDETVAAVRATMRR